MRLSLRFVLPLIVVLVVIAYIVMPLVDQFTLRWFVRDLDMRSALIANTIREPLQERLAAGDMAKVGEFFAHITQDERLLAIGYCASRLDEPVASALFPSEIECSTLERWQGSSAPRVLSQARDQLHVTVRPMPSETAPAASLIFVHDMSFVVQRSTETKQYILYLFVALAIVVSLVTAVIAHLSWRGWVAGMRKLLKGESHLNEPAKEASAPELKPIARDLKELINELESERRARDESQITWTPESLRAILDDELRGADIMVVSNREPYIHEQRGDRVEVLQPASGLVTALEPVMRACSGVWIAHGSGSADKSVVDANDKVGVPPGKPDYQLRRIWLTHEQESGYYDGFANEGLWPLCHIAHVRPTFRASDWAQYVAVNRKFAAAVVSEAKTEEPIVLVQDYHFALLPKMIRDALPQATVITFWHIPWPNPESFSICPWGEEILQGLLGSSILGFHTQFHCNNFVDTVDTRIEARVDREALTVSYGGKLTAIHRYPISISWPPKEELIAKPVDQCAAEVRQENGLPADHKIGIGVDRMDYTKGILERLSAVESFLELNPEWRGRFTFIQIAAPSRPDIEAYQSHRQQVETLVASINARFPEGPPAILLKVEHHDAKSVYEYYRASDVCFVSSLHDGMNLVAKEFVASRDDERGVLILSQFTGAARELPEALIVNPYDSVQCAQALLTALTMPASEQRDRMLLMRGLVREFNVYRWAGRMLLDAATMRRSGKLLEKPTASPT